MKQTGPTGPVHLDANGTVIDVGDRVEVGPKPEDKGVITKITELDGDVDDEGRTYSISPSVHVRFDDGVEDAFVTSTTSYIYGGYDEPEWRCDDVVKSDSAAPVVTELEAERSRLDEQIEKLTWSEEIPVDAAQRQIDARLLRIAAIDAELAAS